MTILLNRHHCETEVGVRICMIVNWDMNFFCICHCSLTNDRYNKAEDCICILAYERKWLFIIFLFDCLLLNTDFFFSCFDNLLLNFKRHFQKLDVIPLFISRNSVWFSIKIVNIYIWFLPCYNTERHNKEDRQHDKEGILFPSSYVMLRAVCW